MKRTIFLTAVLLSILAGNVFGQKDDYVVQQLSNGTLSITDFARGAGPTIRDGTYTIPRELYGTRVTSIGKDFTSGLINIRHLNVSLYRTP